MNVLIPIVAWGIFFPLAIVAVTRGWTPPRPRWAREDPLIIPGAGRPPGSALPPAAPAPAEPPGGPAVFYERIATNAELTRAAAAADQASAAACRTCGRNHFADCPPGARVIDGRTGELAGYWGPRGD